ncbi:MAG TPA: hypothetical protein VF132_07975 [Rudaea sp.]
MDTRQRSRALDPAWRRWTLLGALFVLGVAYVAAFALFVARSENFIEKQRLDAAAAYSREHKAQVPSTLSFRSGSADIARLGGGWHRPEEAGVWSSEKNAWIAVSTRDFRADLLVRLNLIAFAPPPRPRLQIRIDVDGQPLGAWDRDSATGEKPLEVRVPAALLRDGQITIALHTDHVDSPFHLGIGADKRKLGVLLSSIELRPASSPTE